MLGTFGAIFEAIHKQNGFRKATNGLIVIDEPELHLHVALQKTFMPTLLKFFPGIQFVVATHSPVILNSLDNAVVYDLEKPIPLEGMTKAACGPQVASG